MRSRLTGAPDQAYRAQLLPPEGSQFDLNAGFALSPDGRTLAFVSRGPGKDGIWLRPVDGSAARLLPGTAGAFFPFWSPDSRSIAYGAGGKLWRLGVSGGSPATICDTLGVFMGGDWLPDGVIVFGESTRGLRLVPASGGTSEPLTKSDAARGETSHQFPQGLPGGRILFSTQGQAENAGIYAISRANPRERVRLPVTTGASQAMYAAGHLFWLRGSALVAQRFDPEHLRLEGDPEPIADPVGLSRLGKVLFSASSQGLLVHGRAGGTQLNWVDRAGQAAKASPNSTASASNPPSPTNKLGSPLGEPADYGAIRLSPDGRRVAVIRGSSSGSDLWLADVERNAWSRFTFLPGFAEFPVWAPNGRQVIFRAGAPPNLYRKEASGAGAEQRLTESVNPQWPTDWSRNGRWLLYHELAPDTQRDLWVLPVTPEGKPEAPAQPYLRTRFTEFQGRFSPEPNPRWVAYTSNESGRNEVYVQAFPEPRGKFQISTSGGQSPEWSPDGRELFYESLEGKLTAVGLEWRADAVVPSAPRELFDLPAAFSGGNFPSWKVAPDGKRFLVLKPAGGAQPLEVIANWQALLKGAAKE
jgi:Tol biopolymer transport system component